MPATRKMRASAARAREEADPTSSAEGGSTSRKVQVKEKGKAGKERSEGMPSTQRAKEKKNESKKAGNSKREHVEHDFDFAQLKADESEGMAPLPSGEGARIEPAALRMFVLKLGQVTPQDRIIKIWLKKDKKKKRQRQKVTLPRSTSDADPLTTIQLDVTAAEFAAEYANTRQFIDYEVSGDWRLVTADGIVLAVHVTNVLGLLLQDAEKGLEEAARMGKWLEDEVIANGGAPQSATQSRHSNYLPNERDPRKGVSHLFAWSPNGHDDPSQIRPSKDMQAEYVSRLGENLSVAMEAVLKTLWVLDNKAYKTLVENWNEKLAGSSFATRIDNPFFRHQGLVLVHNIPADPHLDVLDSRRVMTAMMPTGDFLGGQLSLETIGLRSEYRPGDLVFIRSWLVKHGVMAINPEGIRHTLVFILQERLANKGEHGADWEGLKTGEATFGSTPNEEEARRKGDEEAARVRREREMEQELEEVTRSGKGKGQASAEDVQRWERERAVRLQEQEQPRLWQDAPF